MDVLTMVYPFLENTWVSITEKYALKYHPDIFVMEGGFNSNGEV